MGKSTINDQNYGTSAFLMGKSTISMSIFNRFLYVHERVILANKLGILAILGTISPFFSGRYYIFFGETGIDRWIFDPVLDGNLRNFRDVSAKPTGMKLT
jgi:hypothetical protein